NPLVPFDHTYILYDESNIFSLAVALFSLLPILILVFLFSWFVVTREIECCLIALGQVINDVISCMLKKLVKLERPTKGQIFKKEGGLVYGMPSSHAQFMAFFVTYMSLRMFLQWPTPVERSTKIGLSVLLVAAQVLVCYSRLYFEYHDLAQIWVGTLLGQVLGSLCFLVVALLRDLGVVNRALDLQICQFLFMKDSF
ncbi:uncharacterized protein OGAPODRAFT_38952, partial [Ogataea polymorpha]|uniref:uncharacterized protein n=1 Tax=Ogataea polymorpha TaxID=460523 RepID=UPI0007F38353